MDLLYRYMEPLGNMFFVDSGFTKHVLMAFVCGFRFQKMFLIAMALLEPQTTKNCVLGPSGFAGQSSKLVADDRMLYLDLPM